MSTVTKNYKFIKPDLTDPADIRVINNNFDKLDDMIFRSGEVANHVADPNAHSELFAKYLPLEGGTMTGKLTGTSAEFTLNATFGQNILFNDNNTSSIMNGYGKTYGAKATFYGNDITSGYTGRKNQLWLESARDANTYTKMSLTPDTGVTISTGSGRTTKYALYCPSIGTSTIYSNNNNLNFLESYNGNCSMQFKDLGANQFIQFKVMDNVIKISKDGVFYNDMPSLYVMDTQITTGTLQSQINADTVNYTCRMTKYCTGLLIYELKTIPTNRSASSYVTFTFPIPFIDTNYVVGNTAIREDASWGMHGDYISQMWRATTTTIDLVAGAGNCDETFIIRGRWK